MAVVIGNVRDPEWARLRRMSGRMRRVAGRRDVWDAGRGEMIDETGLTMHHELPPNVASDLHKLAENVKSGRTWLAVLGGFLVGILLAGIAWWMTTQNRSLTVREE